MVKNRSAGTSTLPFQFDRNGFSFRYITVLWALSQILASLPQAEEHVYFIRSSLTSLVKTSLMSRDLTPEGQMLLLWM